MAYKNIPAKDASGNTLTLRGQDNGDGSVTFTHSEDAAQRAALLAQLATLSTSTLQATANTALVSLGAKIDTLAGKLDLANARQGSAASIGGTISATGPTASVSVRGDFNITFYGTFSGTLSIERSFDNTVWVPLTALGSTVSFYSPATEIFNEPEAGVKYRLNCTSLSSGTITWRISQ